MLQDRRDLCEPCSSDEGVDFTIRGNVGTCLSLVTLEGLAAVSAGDESGGLSTAGKITIPLGVLGFIGGIAVGWYRLENDKKEKKEQAKKFKKLEKNLKKKAGTIQKENPMFAGGGVSTSIDGGLYDDPAAAPHKCGWTSAAGRTCAQEATDLHCDRHTCTNADCTNGKESKATFCDACDIGSGFGGDANV